MDITDEQIEELGLTPKQLVATKAVFKAMKAAGRLGVSFWDNYGTLTAYNAKKINVPVMEDMARIDMFENMFLASDGDGALVLYYENLRNFYCGNADDEFYAQIL